jgi:Sterol carrier protein domain
VRLVSLEEAEQTFPRVYERVSAHRRWLLGFDWTSQIVARLLPLDHPLFLLLAEPRRMAFELNDGVWVRLVDVGAALSARTYRGDGAVVFDVRDSSCPWNEGRWRVSSGGAERVDAEPERSRSTSPASAPSTSAASRSRISGARRAWRSPRRARWSARMRSLRRMSSPGAPRSSLS